MEYCVEHDIQHQYLIPYTPLQYGVAKRKNKSLKEMENRMLQSKSTTPSFWGEAINCAKYIQNHTPHKVIQDLILEEAWSRINLDVSFFRVFGSEVWAFILDGQCKEMDKKSQ